MFGIDIKRSAYKHDITYDDIMFAMTNYIQDLKLPPPDSGRYMRIGYGIGFELLEVGYQISDEFNYTIFHAMKCRKYYRDKLKGADND
jgi:hypothetical protein